jgi:NADPH:quinone reductase-like Zn-dependent oxidoreductase
MRALQIDHYGGPEMIIQRDLPVPTPRQGELLIRLAYSGINFMDIHMRQGKYAASRTYPQTMPTTLGKPTLRDSMRSTRTKGLIVSFGSVGGSIDDLDPIELGEAGSLFLTRPRLADHLTDAATIRRRAADIFSSLLDGTLSIEIAGRYTLDNVKQAHHDLEHRQTVGKPVIEI